MTGRIHHTISRDMEFFKESELTMRIGHAPELWGLALLKELIDNALDAAEQTGMPAVGVTLEDDCFIVADNGPGIPDDVITRSLDYSTRTSDGLLYAGPSRGQLGNALKTVWAASFVRFGASGVVVENARNQHDILVTLDEYRQGPEIKHEISPSEIDSGHPGSSDLARHG